VLLGRKESGVPGITCCHRDLALDKRKKLDGWMCVFVYLCFHSNDLVLLVEMKIMFYICLTLADTEPTQESSNSNDAAATQEPGTKSKEGCLAIPGSQSRKTKTRNRHDELQQ